MAKSAVASTVVRGRVVATLVVCLCALFPVIGHGGWVALAVGVGVCLSQGITLAVALQVRSTVFAPGGDLMFRSGDRADGAAMRRLLWLGQLDFVVAAACLVVGAMAGPRWAFGAFFGIIPLTLLWGTGRLQRGNLMMLRGIHALDRGEAAEVLEAVEGLMDRPELRTGALSIKIQALARLGQTEQAYALLEQNTAGMVDSRGVALALARLERGDSNLAVAILATSRPENLFERYWFDRLTAHFAVVEGRFDEVQVATEGFPMPFLRPLAMLDVAARRGRGETVEIAPADLAYLAHWETWYPRVWAVLQGELAPVLEMVGSTGSPPDVSFIDAAAPTAPSKLTGPVPMEWLARARVTRSRRVVQAVLLPVLFGLGVLLGVLSLILRALGGSPPGFLVLVPAVAAVAVGVSAAGLARLAVDKLVRPGPRNVVFADGRQVDVQYFWLWSVGRTLPSMVSAGTLMLVGPAFEFAFLGTLWMLLLLFPVGLFLTWAIARLLWMQRLALVAHTRSVAEFRETVARTSTWLLLGEARWLTASLACLLDADRDGAVDALERARAFSARGSELQLWLAAGDGQVAVETLLESPEGEGAGAQYRRAIAVLLASRARAESVPGEALSRYEALASSLPNVFGDLLGALLASEPLPMEHFAVRLWGDQWPS